MDTTGNAALHILQNLQFAKCGLKTTAIELRYFGIIALIFNQNSHVYYLCHYIMALSCLYTILSTLPAHHNLKVKYGYPLIPVTFIHAPKPNHLAISRTPML